MRCYRAHQELKWRSYVHQWIGVVTIPIRTHQAEGKELPGYNASRGPIVGSLQVLEVVVGFVSVGSFGSFRDQLTSSTSGEITWVSHLWDAGRRSDARARWITVDGVDGHSMSRVELELER